MRRNPWTIVAASIAVLIAIVFVILAFTAGGRQPQRTAVNVEEPPPTATQPARPAERGAGEQPSGKPSTTAEQGAPQTTQPSPTTGTQPQPQAGQPQPTTPPGQAKQPAPRPATQPTVQQQLDAITGGKSTKPAMVEFGADWCPPCKKMKPIVQDLEKQYGDKVDIVYVDVDKYPDLAGKYNISAIPVQIFYNKQGKQVERHEGFYPRNEIVSQFQQMGIRK